MPITLPPTAGLPVLLAERDTDLSGTAADLTARGASVEMATASDDDVAAWLRALPA